MTPDSFNIGIINSYDTWGIKVIAYDVVSPPKRSRKQQVPHRSGMYDYGAKYYDERTLRIDCRLTRKISKSDFREIVYVLSQKSRIFLWDEPDKYYIAELYESVDVDVFPDEIQRNFLLPFVCDPFAYSSQRIIPIKNGVNPIDYGGTAETPTLFIIKNPNNYPITNITLTAIIERS